MVMIGVPPKPGSFPKKLKLAIRAGPSSHHSVAALVQAYGRGLGPRLSKGTLQLSSRCSSFHFSPRRSFPVSRPGGEPADGDDEAWESTFRSNCDCSCPRTGDDAGKTSGNTKANMRPDASFMAAAQRFGADSSRMTL